MLKRLTCVLTNVAGYIPGDALHGVIMEHTLAEYAEKLHSQGVHPYSQYPYRTKGSVYWVIQTLTKEAGDNIIAPLSSPDFSRFHLKRLNRAFLIAEKTESEMPIKDLVNYYYFGERERIVRLRFLTPTAFKSGGEYVFYPDLRLLFGSLMRKYAYLYENGEADTPALDALIEHTKIVRYDLKSVYNSIGRVKLPAFCGTVVIKASGPQALVNYMNFLLHFGEYSGVGIKCSLGMGAIKIIDKLNDKEGL